MLGRVGLQARHHVAPHMREHLVRVARVQGVAGNGDQRDDHAGHPFRRFGDVGIGVDLAGVARGDQIAAARTRPGRAPGPARRRPRTRRTPRVRPSAAASAARRGRRRRCGRAPRPRRSASSRPSIRSSIACASDQYASLSRTIAAPSSDALSGKCRYSQPRDTRAASATSDTVVARIPLARRHTSAASISRSRTLLAAVLLVTRSLLVVHRPGGRDQSILPTGRRILPARPGMVDRFANLFTERDGPR